MDFQMPKMDGIEATLMIRNTDNLNKNTPIIDFTASAMSEQKNKALDIGMNDFLSKPFTPDQFDEMLYKNVTSKSNDPLITDEFEFSSLINKNYMDEMYKKNLNLVEKLLRIFIESTFAEMKKIEIFNEKSTRESLHKWLHKNSPSFEMVGIDSFYVKLSDLKNKFSDQKNDETELKKSLCTLFQEILKRETELNDNFERLKMYNQKMSHLTE
jgi:CheY-like chemotaxis protein